MIPSFSRTDSTRRSVNFPRPRKIGLATAHKLSGRCGTRCSPNPDPGAKSGILWWWRRSAWRTRRRGNRPGSARFGCGFDLVADFRDFSQTDLIEQPDHVSVQGKCFGAEGNFYVLIGFMKLVKPGQNVVTADGNVVEIDEVSLSHADRDVIFFIGIGRLGSCARQINSNALHVGLAQADHHKAGEEKEHDVDQGDDLDARSLVRNWRSHFHGLVLAGEISTALRSS